MTWKHTVAKALYRSGALSASRLLSRHFDYETGSRKLRPSQSAKYLILAYHRIGTGGVPIYSQLPQAAFRRQMEYLRRNYRVISLHQMIQELEDPPRRGLSVTVTFDDGYRGTFTEAFPVLREYSIPATVYLLAGAVENNTIAWYDRIFLALQQTTKETFTVTLGPRKEYTLSSPATREQAATEIITHLRSV